MLDLTISHAEELQKCFKPMWFQDKYKFWNFTSYHKDMEITDSAWSKHQFVPSDSSSKVIGYTGYEITKSSGVVNGLNIINFTDNKTTFGMNAGQAPRDIFGKFHFGRLVFVIVTSNPIEKAYDRIIRRYRGRIVGIQHQHARLIDGEFYDVRIYETLSDNYFGRGASE